MQIQIDYDRVRRDRITRTGKENVAKAMKAVIAIEQLFDIVLECAQKETEETEEKIDVFGIAYQCHELFKSVNAWLDRGSEVEETVDIASLIDKAKASCIEARETLKLALPRGCHRSEESRKATNIVLMKWATERLDNARMALKLLNQCSVEDEGKESEDENK